MNVLKIDLIGNDWVSDSELISLSINSASSSEVLFTGRIDLHSLTEWLTEHEIAIRENIFPIENSNNFSLAECAYYFYENVDADDDKAIDAMYEYRESHCLRFACRGYDFPDIYIGSNGGKSEISLHTNHMKWRHYFDINSFFSSFPR